MSTDYGEDGRHLISAVNKLIETLFNSNYLRMTQNDKKEILYEITGEIEPRNIRNIAKSGEFTKKFYLLEQIILIYYYLFRLEEKNVIIAINESSVHILDEIKKDPKFRSLEEILGLSNYETTLTRWEENASSLKPNKVMFNKNEFSEEVKEILKLLNHLLNNFILLIEIIINHRVIELNRIRKENKLTEPLKLDLEKSIMDGNMGLRITFENFLFSREISILQDPIDIKTIESELDEDKWIRISFNIMKEKFHNLELDINHFDLYKQWNNLSTHPLLYPNSHYLEKNIENVKDMLFILKSILDLIQKLADLDLERIALEKNAKRDKSDLKKFYEKIITFDEKNAYSNLCLSRISYQIGNNVDAKKYFDKAFESKKLNVNCFSISAVPIIVDYVVKNDTISRRLIENFVEYYEDLSTDTRSLIFQTLQNVRDRNIDLILLKKLDKFEVNESDLVLARFDNYAKNFSDVNNIFIASQCLKNLCEKTSNGDKWISREQLVEGLEKVVNPEIIIPLVIVNFKKSGLIILDEEKIALTDEGKSHCGKQIKLDRSI